MAAVAVNGEYRRGKAALFVIACGWAGALPHWIESSLSLWPAITLAFLLGGYGLRTVLYPVRGKRSFHVEPDFEIQSLDDQKLPYIDVLVAARDEEAVIGRLVARIDSLRYPKARFSTWIIDDGSRDRTAVVLQELAQTFDNLNVISRSPDEGGGKSGALNQALSKLKGDWLLILDADAQLQEDALYRLVTFAQEGSFSAVQLRKAVINASHNSLTRLQAMEMAMDAVIQQGRLTLGGVGELRGNGQLIRRSVIENCGGFNEETVTDDLDLSFRLLFADALVGILWNPPVQEEAVETVHALWRQRQRWAEGGLQRFFDYWPSLISSRLSVSQKLDLACFFLLQYALPVISLADLMTAAFTRTMPTYWPLSIVAFSVSGFAFWRGCRSFSEGPDLPSPQPLTILLAIFYLSHWFVVIPWVTIRMALFPKKLIWAKTTHHG